MSAESILWDPEQSPARGATRDRILKWEAERGVQLPKLLRKVYREHNGGLVRSTQLELYALEQIVPPDERAWATLHPEKADAGAFVDHSRVLIIGWDNESGGQYFLNYNECYDDEDPSIWSCTGSESGIRRVSPSASRYLKKLATASDKSEVDWEESERLEVLADDVVDESSWLPPGTVSRYLLARGDGVLVLYRESLDFGTGGKRLTRIELPLPLEADAMILRQRRMDGPWTLQLQPKRSSGIIYIESTELPTGGWRNRRSKGAPAYDVFESESKEKLEELRIELIGEKAARECEAEDDRMVAFQRRVSQSSPDELQVIGFQLLHAMQGTLPDEELEGVSAVPPMESAAHIRHLMNQMRAEVANRGGDEPIPADVQAMLDGLNERLNAMGLSDSENS